MRVEARKEGTADAKSTGTGDGLSDGNLKKQNLQLAKSR